MAPNNPKPTLLSMPDEILEYITAEVLQPTEQVNRDSTIYELDRHKPLKRLLTRLSKASACRRLRNIALPAYFRLTRLTVVLGRTRIPYVICSMGSRSGVRTRLADFGVQSGTFEDHDVYLANLTKLLLELVPKDFCNHLLEATAALLLKCERLSEVTTRRGNLDDDQNAAFKRAVDDAVDEAKQTSDRDIRVSMETAEEYCSQMAAGNELRITGRTTTSKIRECRIIASGRT